MRKILMAVAVAVACSACGDESGADDDAQAQRHPWRDADGCYRLNVPVAQLCEAPAVYVPEGHGCYADFGTPQARPLGPVLSIEGGAFGVYSESAVLLVRYYERPDGTMFGRGTCAEADADGALQPVWEVTGGGAVSDNALCRPCGDL